MQTAINPGHIEFLLIGAWWTLVLSAMAFIGGGLTGFAVALGRTAPLKVIRVVTGFYVQIIQGTPLLVILFLTYPHPNLQTNKADIVISTLSVTPGRDEVIDFSTPYAALESVIGAPADADISGWEDVKGKSVTVTRGTTQDADLTAIAEEKGFDVVRYKDDATMVTAALSGQAEMVATSATVVNEIGERNEDLGFEPKFVITTFDLAIGVRENEPVLMEKLNEWVTANLKNGKLNDIYQKYHGTPLPDAMLQ